MRSKPHPIMSSYGLCIVMLVALLTHANAIPVDNSLTMTRSSATISQPVAFNSSLDDTRAEHRLRTDTETMANDGDDNFEERLLEGIGLGTTRIRTVLETMMLKLKLLINKAMTKFGLTKQSKVDKFFERIVKKSAPNADEIPELESKEFDLWSRFTEDTYKDNAKDADAAMVTTLVKHYGDVPLVTMLLAAEKDLSTRNIAIRLLKAQFTRWETTGKSSGKVFKLLKLDKAGDELFQNPMMDVWMSYTKMHLPETQHMAWPVLLKHYKNEADLAIMLEKAADDDETEYIAKWLMDVRTQYWQKIHKSAADAFKVLKLNKAGGDELLQNPMMRIWVGYVLTFDTPQAAMAWPVLLKHYTDEETITAVLAKALATGKESEAKVVAKRAMDLRLKHWYFVKAKSVEEAFKLLKLDKAGDKLIENPMLKYWASYVRRFIDETQIEKAWLLLLKHYEDEGALMMKLIEAMKEKKTRPVAEDLLWIQSKVSHFEKKKAQGTSS